MSSIPVWVRNAIVVIAATIVVIALTFCGRAKADEAGAAVEAMPSDCVEVRKIEADLTDAIAAHGGVLGQATGLVAQSLSDASRRAAHMEAMPVAVALIWIRQAVIVAEFGPDGCLIDMLKLDLRTFSDILAAMPKVSPAF